MYFGVSVEIHVRSCVCVSAVQTENKSLPLAILFIFSLIIYHMVRTVNNVNHYQDHLEFNKASIATTRKKYTNYYSRRQEEMRHGGRTKSNKG